MVGVDLGGRSASPDCSAISVIDCHDRICETVAQWRGHIDHDLLIEKAIAIASFYNQALLVVESNTLETHASDGKSAYLLRRLKDEYSNVFRRKTEPHGFKVGFQTNVLTKAQVVNHLVTMVREGLLVEHDSDAIDEMSWLRDDRVGGSVPTAAKQEDRLRSSL